MWIQIERILWRNVLHAYSADTAVWKNKTVWNAMQAVEGCWYWYIFINNNTLLCIVDYFSKFPVMKKADGLSADHLTRAAIIVFTKFGPPKEKFQMQAQISYQNQFKEMFKQLNMDTAITWSYHHQSSGQGKAWIKFVKLYNQKCFDKNNDINLTLLQKRPMPISTGLPSPATLLVQKKNNKESPVVPN